MMGKVIDMTGMKIGMLTVISRDNSAHGSGVHARWICKCECGNIVSISSHALRGKSPQKSCGCLPAKMHTTHGYSDTRLYAIWICMKQRCRNPNNRNYRQYGARGISVCEEWKDFETFRSWALSNGYDETAKRGICTIDRINNDGNYGPDNCRFVSQKIQSNNRRNTVKVLFKGEQRTLSEISQLTGVCYGTLHWHKTIGDLDKYLSKKEGK